MGDPAYQNLANKGGFGSFFVNQFFFFNNVSNVLMYYPLSKSNRKILSLKKWVKIKVG